MTNVNDAVPRSPRLSLLERVRTVLEMIKFSHTVFALPFAIMAACLASRREGGWRLLDFVGVLACMIFARSAAMGFNRWADRAFDAANPRTANRALPAGVLTPRFVLTFVLGCALGFVASTALFWLSSGNRWPIVLSVPVLAWLLGYSYAKRFTPFAHVWLATALALAPLAAWMAIRPVLELAPLLLGLVIVLWVTGFDILYACQDIEVDRRLGLQSLPARVGLERAMAMARSSHALMVVALVGFAWMTPEAGPAFWSAVAATAVLLLVEHALVRGRDLQRVNLAFFHVNAAISLGLFAALVLDLALAR